MVEYKIYASLKQDMNEGWVWFNCPDVPERSVVKIAHECKTVYCEARIIDKNYRRDYNQQEYTIDLDESKKVITINGWYRSKLNIETKKCHNISITPANHCCGRFRASFGHPQNVVRLAMGLAIISVGLGVVGVVIASCM